MQILLKNILTQVTKPQHYASNDKKQGCDNYSFKTKIDEYSILKFYSIPLILKNTNMINLHFLENEKFSCHSKIPLGTAFYQSDTCIVFLSFFFRLLLLIYQRSGFPGGQYCRTSVASFKLHWNKSKLSILSTLV